MVWQKRSDSASFFCHKSQECFFSLWDVWHDVYRVTNTLLAFSFCLFLLLLFFKTVKQFWWEPDATVYDTHLYVCCESFTCAPWLIHVWACDVTHLFIRVSWLICVCNVTRSYGIWRHMWHVAVANGQPGATLHDVCMLIERNPPPRGGVSYLHVLSSRTVSKRTPLEAPDTNSSRGVLLLTVLDEGT